ncbi:hypothetical protein AO067_23370 [Pseudomonas viridiflava ICMP 13104]|uniref:Uncharacterized protein n=1 Tax=Pseudomonas viridiflava ICMP 13104 TaxID=1198305 RepID=A0A0W0HXQ8_PSEVI|nr:hypothetical protein AO067_23370 [Pseudomonas viridiflava ICMP 13104]
MIGAYLLCAVLVVYALPLGFTLLYAWLMSTKTGVRFELSFAEASRNFRHAMLFGSLFGILLFPVEHFFPMTPAVSLYVCAQLVLLLVFTNFFPMTPAVSLYVCAQLVLLLVFTIRLSCLAVVLPLGEHSTGTRLAYGTLLATVILICQPALYIAWAILR